MSRPSSGFSGWRHPSSPYDVLGVSRFASNAEIRRAYRKRALETHPDKQYQFGATEEEGLAAEALFREVLEAFELLNDPHKRRIYDIHARPPPTPGAVTHRRSSTETNVSGAERGDTASTVDEPRDHTVRAQDRSEWTRQGAEAHRAWRAERTKSYSATPTPVKIAHNQYPTKATSTPDTPPSKLATSRTTTTRATSHNSTFSYSPIPSSPPSNPTPIKSFSNTSAKTFSSASSIKSFSTTSSSSKISPAKSVFSSASLSTTPPTTTTINTRSRSDTTSTTYTNNSATNSTRSRSGTADSTSTNATTMSIKSKSSATSISNASTANDANTTSHKPSTPDTDSTKGEPDGTKPGVLGYEEWVERILAELYLMAPEWMNADKNGPHKMGANTV